MKTIFPLTTLLFCYLPLWLFNSFIPYLTRRTESFGVRIPEEKYCEAEVRQLRGRYRNQNLWAGAVILLIALIVSYLNTEASMLVIPIGILAEIGLMFIFYSQGHQRMMQLKETKGWGEKTGLVTVDTSNRNRKMLVSPFWFIIYGLIILGTVFLGFSLYDRMPQRVPIHFNYLGQPDRWVAKSLKILFFAPMLQTMIGILMGFVYWIINRAKQEIDSANPEQSLEQNRLFRYRWSGFVVFAGMAMLLSFTFLQYSFSMPVNPWVVTVAPISVTGLIVIAAMILSVNTGQGGSRIKIKRAEGGGAISREDDRYWKLGMFYYNPDDPALFVEKRFGIGWTNNFARPLSWILLIGVLVLLPTLIVLATRWIEK